MRRRLDPSRMYPAREPDVRVHYVRLADGIRVRVLELGPAHGAPVVLVHGWAACVFTWRHLLRALAAEGRRAIAFDLPGHGLSDKPREGWAYTTGALLAQLGELLDALGVARADLCGHSLGGGAVLRFALAVPERVRRVVLAAPVNLVPVRMRFAAQLVSPPLFDALAAHVVRRAFVIAVLRGVAGSARAIDDEIIDEYWAPSRDPGYYAAASRLLRDYDWEPIAPGTLGRLAAPALVVLGARDPLLPGAAVAAKTIARTKTLVVPGVGHLVLDEAPSRVNDAIVRFLGAPDVA